MNTVQKALENIGIPVMKGIWRTGNEEQNPPAQYIIYSTTTTETAFSDDTVKFYCTYVYMDLWSKTDPTEMAEKVRKAMYLADFSMVEESDRGSSRSSYNSTVKLYNISWTWCSYFSADSDTEGNEVIRNAT